MSKRITNPKDLRFVILRQHMANMSLKKQIEVKDKQIQKLTSTIKRLRRDAWYRRLLEKIKRFFKGNNA